jgi:hypothetical protein
MSRRVYVAWLTFLALAVVGTTAWLVIRAPSAGADIAGDWVLDRVQTSSVDQALHGPPDFRTGLGVGASRAFVDQGCGGFEFGLENTPRRLHFILRQQDRSYGPCEPIDPTPGRWDLWMARVDHAERRGGLLVLTGPGVRLVWHQAPPPPPPDPVAVPLDGAWLVQSVRDGGRDIVPDPRHPAVLGVDSFGLTLDTGCTIRGAHWHVSGYHHWVRVVLTPSLHHTCRSRLMPQERAVLRGFRGARRLHATARTLELTGTSIAVTLRRLPRPQIEQLTGTRWVLDGLVDGSVTTPARRFRAAPATPRVSFSVVDGFTNLNRGCRGTAGGFGIDGAGRIQPLTPRDHCHFSTPLDRYLTAVYSHPWWFRILGDTLSVQGSSGRGLIYRRVGADR